MFTNWQNLTLHLPYFFPQIVHQICNRPMLNQYHISTIERCRFFCHIIFSFFFSFSFICTSQHLLIKGWFTLANIVGKNFGDISMRLCQPYLLWHNTNRIIYICGKWLRQLKTAMISLTFLPKTFAVVKTSQFKNLYKFPHFVND